jgi:glycogen operon protein
VVGAGLQLEQACPGQLGAHVADDGVHFALHAPDAERVTLCLFDEAGRETAQLLMPACDGGVWYGLLSGARPGLRYGYRVEGPYVPREGLRFNGHKLLLDPYARELAGALHWHEALCGYRVGAINGDMSFDSRDSAPYLPKGVVSGPCSFDWGDDRPPRVPWCETVVYELHVKGFTRLLQQVGAAERGSYAALGSPAVIDHLRRLGITAVELLPIHAFASEPALLARGLRNYWGYNSFALFAPHAAYAAGANAAAELKGAVRALHAAGIEVILDVVYNHTAEGDEYGPTLSWRGLDNRGYYRLDPREPRFYANHTGCGNTLDFSRPAVIRLVMDSLRHWVSDYHIDGFRFDLSPVLGREAHGFDPGAGFFDALRQDPLLAATKLIAEPWDVGPGGYQVGQHPPPFAEWNDRFRDTVRRYWRGDDHCRGPLAAALQGSAELFERERRSPWASVNFIAAHDGFTLEDIVSYAEKHNQANGEDNRDGSNENNSCNWGEEGIEAAPDVLAQRDRIKRALLTTLLVSHGTPMLCAGDELGRSQLGNNNAYCQDNEVSWLDWSLAASPRGRALFEYTRRLLALRRSLPLLQGRYFQHSRIEVAPGLTDLFWFDERGQGMNHYDWNNPTGRLLGVRRARRRDDGGIDIVILLFNGDAAPHTFRLPEPAFDCCMLLQSAQPEAAAVAVGQTVEVAPWSAALLASPAPAGAGI